MAVGGGGSRQRQRPMAAAATEEYSKKWRQRAAPPPLEVGVTWVHKSGAWVDPFLRAEPSQGESTKLETLEWRLKALLPCFPLSRIFFPDSTLLNCVRDRKSVGHS